MGSPSAPVVANRLLDLEPGVGQVKSTVRFDVVNRDGDVIGLVNPREDRPPTVVNTANATIPRTLRGFELPGTQANELNPYTDRIRPSWILEDGTEWPMGVFLPQTPERRLLTWDSPLTASLVDLTYLLTQERLGSFGASNRARVSSVMTHMVESLGFPSYYVEPSDFRVLDTIAKQPGTRYGQTLGDLCRLVGYLPPFCDNSGTLRLEPPAPLEDGLHILRYPLDVERSRVLVGSAIVGPQTDLPGAYRVYNSGATKGPIGATVFVDPNLPWSREQRGFLLTQTIRSQGVSSTEQAERMATAYARTQPGATGSFESPPDPRHDTWNVVEFGAVGDLWQETSWSLTLQPGAAMQHTIVKGSLSQ